jgi:hypothetical protein
VSGRVKGKRQKEKGKRKKEKGKGAPRALRKDKRLRLHQEGKAT